MKFPSLGESHLMTDDGEIQFFYPNYVTPRLVSQRGVFTVHPAPSVPYTDNIVVQYVIPSELKPDFRKKLDAIGIHHSAIYADLDGLARRLVAVHDMRSGRVGDPTPPPPSKASPDDRKKVNPLDPQKGQWGGSPSRNGWTMSATVKTLTKDWYNIDIVVQAENKGRPLKGDVIFYLHDSFTEPVVKVASSRGKAPLNTQAYGAFTVGAVIKLDETTLELDLSELGKTPPGFRRQ